MAYDIGPKIGVEGEQAFRDSLKAVNEQIKALGAEMASVTAAFSKGGDAEEAAAAKNDVLGRSAAAAVQKLMLLDSQLGTQREKLRALGTALEEAKAQFGANSAEAVKAQNAYNRQSAAVSKLERDYHQTTAQVRNMENAMEDTGDAMDGAGEKASRFGDMLKANLASELITGALRAGAEAVRELGAALADVTKDAVGAYGSYEQLLGGVETLFGAGGKSVEGYAEEVGKSVEEAQGEYDALMAAQNAVLANADSAYNRAGLSANAYMETVTGFAASLIQSLGGDTQKAAEMADVALTDMADNANKMGTSMESIQHAYQGFARGQFTMLDNLKLGYGGTKEEMERLLKDAQAISGVEYDISSYADMVSAIHVIQEEMGITGTTAAEAATTIEGSTAAMKAAWANLLVGLADDSADMDTLMANFVSSAETAAGNLLPRMKTVLQGVGPLIGELGPELAEQIAALAPELLPAAYEIAGGLVSGLASGLSEAGPALGPAAKDILKELAGDLVDLAPELGPAGAEVLLALAEGITDNGGEIVEVGTDLILGLAEGLIDAVPVLLENGPEIVGKLALALGKAGLKLSEAGGELGLKLLVGLVESIPKILTFPREVGKEILAGMKEQGPEFVQMGKDMALGMVEGLKNAGAALIQSGKDLAKDLVDSVKGFLGIHSPSTLFKEEIGENIALGVAEGIDTKANKAVKAADQLAKDVYSRSKEWADRQTKYMELSYTEQIGLWRTIQGQFIAESRQYAQAEEKIFDLREKALSDYKKQWEDYEKELQKGTEKILSWYGLFDEVPERQKVSGEALLENLRGQVEDIAGFFDKLSVLAEREGVGRALVEEIQAMGPSAMAELDALLALSDEKLSEYAALFEEKQGVAEQYAAIDLSGMRQSLTELGTELAEQLEMDMDELYRLCGQEAPEIGFSFAQMVAEGIESGLAEVHQAAWSIGSAAAEAVRSGMGNAFSLGGWDFLGTVGNQMSAAFGQFQVQVNGGGQEEAAASLLTEAVNAMAAMVGSLQIPAEITITTRDGIELARAFLPDIRTADRETPEVKSDV